MPLDPQRVQAIFLEAVDCHDPTNRAAILDRECSTDPELRWRVEALLRAHDELDRSPDEPAVAADPTRRGRHSSRDRSPPQSNGD